MERQTLGTIKGKMALVAEDGGLLVHVVIRTGCGLVSVAGPASGPLAWMVSSIIIVIAAIALVAPIALIDEPGNGGTPLVMIVRLEKDDLVFCVGSTENEEEGMVAAENFQLVWQVQRRQVGLEPVQFWESTGAFCYACGSVQLTRIDALTRSSLTESLPLIPGHVTRVIAMTVGAHGDNGPGTAQFILVADGDDGVLPFTIFLHGSQAHIPLARSTTRGGHSHQHNIDLQSSVRVKFFIAI